MSKYNLQDLFESMSDKEFADAKEKDRLENHPERDKIKAIQALLAKEKANEIFTTDGGSEDSVDNIDKVASPKAKASDYDAAISSERSEDDKEQSDVTQTTKPMYEMNKKVNEARVDREVAERIEGMLSIPLKKKFLDAFMDLWQDLIEEDPFFAEDVINHLNNEMHREIDGWQATGDKLAGMEEDNDPSGADLEGDPDEKVMGENGDVDDYAEEISEEMDDSVKDLLDKIASHLKGSDRNFQDGEIEMYIDSLKRDIKRGEFDGIESISMEDHEEDLENYIADRSLQEHFKRFM